MEHMDEEDERIEEEMRNFKEHLESKYGVTMKDIMKRLDDLNHKLDQVNETVKLIEENMIKKTGSEWETAFRALTRMTKNEF